MGIYIRGMKMPRFSAEYELRLYVDSDGAATVEGAYGCFEGEPFEAVSVPPHGRLIDESKISLAEYEQAAHDALHNGKGSIMYDSGVLAGARAITQLVRRAPTIIPAEEAEDAESGRV